MSSDRKPARIITRVTLEGNVGIAVSIPLAEGFRRVGEQGGSVSPGVSEVVVIDEKIDVEQWERSYERLRNRARECAERARMKQNTPSPTAEVVTTPQFDDVVEAILLEEADCPPANGEPQPDQTAPADHEAPVALLKELTAWLRQDAIIGEQPTQFALEFVRMLLDHNRI